MRKNLAFLLRVVVAMAVMGTMVIIPVSANKVDDGVYVSFGE